MTRSECIFETLKTQGYAYLEQEMTLEDYLRVSGSLGQVAQLAVLRISKQGDYAVQPAEVVMHTDNPEVDTIGWYCVDQDADDGANIFIDAHDVYDFLDEPDREALKTVMVKAPDIKTRGQTVNHVPVIRESGAGLLFYYTPWLVQSGQNERQSAALQKLESYLGEKRQSSPIRVRLRPGQAVFIDNRRLLHGRSPLPTDSRRCLVRAWISKTFPNRTFVSNPHPSLVNLQQAWESVQ